MKEKMVFAPASVLFLLFVFLKQFYLFPSGGMGAADVCLLLSFFILLAGCLKKKERIGRVREDGFFYVFLLFVIGINAYYGIRLGRNEFFRYTFFWIYNACAIWTFRKLVDQENETFLLWMNRVVKVNIVLQLLVYASGHGRIFHEYWGAVRYQGTFNDPNQLAFFLFMMVLLLYLYRCRFGDRSFLIFYLLALPVLAASKSTGIRWAFWFLPCWQERMHSIWRDAGERFRRRCGSWESVVDFFCWACFCGGYGQRRISM